MQFVTTVVPPPEGEELAAVQRARASADAVPVYRVVVPPTGHPVLVLYNKLVASHVRMKDGTIAARLSIEPPASEALRPQHATFTLDDVEYSLLTNFDLAVMLHALPFSWTLLVEPSRLDEEHVPRVLGIAGRLLDENGEPETDVGRVQKAFDDFEQGVKRSPTP